MGRWKAWFDFQLRIKAKKKASRQRREELAGIFILKYVKLVLLEEKEAGKHVEAVGQTQETDF